MKVLRWLWGIWCATFVFAWTAFWVVVAALLTALTFNRSISLAMARRIWGPGILLGMRAKLTRVGRVEFDASRPHVFVMNHQSLMDPSCAFVSIPANLRFVAKHTLQHVPFLGWYMWMTGMIFVDRKNRARAMRSIDRAAERIRAGASILAFPEGTRSLDGALLPFKKGPFVLAVKAGVPIVPVVIEGSGRLLPKGRVGSNPGEIRVKLGTPIPTAGLRPSDRDALMERVRNTMIDMSLELGGRGGDKAHGIAAVGEEGLARDSG